MPDKALLLGINNYKSISDLRGCVNDIRNIKKLLVEDFGFDGQNNIRMLSNEDVVLDNVNAGFKWLFDDLNPGDRAVFHFSGHGSYVVSENDDEPTDEILCLWDMDWNDENSYLIDDDLGNLTEELPKGAHLTVILDNCNSGTGTRAISGGRTFRSVEKVDSKSRLVIESDTLNSAPQQLKQKSRSLFESKEASFRPSAENPVVFARFIFPPDSHQAPNPLQKMRSLGRSLSELELNHTLLTGARDDQTAADAFIEGDYRGAFSHYLCRASRSLGVSVAVKEIMREARTNLSAAGYSQIPQLEGIGKSERLFGGEADPVSDFGGEPSQELNDIFRNDTVPANNTPSNIESLNVLSKLIDLQDKFLSLGTTILGGSVSASGAFVSSSSSRTDSSHEVIVYVHGISRHVSGYSDAWYQSLQPHLSRVIPKQEVLWSDLVNPRSSGAVVPRQLGRETSQMAGVLRDELASRRERLAASLPQGGEQRGSVGQLDRGDGFALDDFARYMTNSATRNAILERFDRVLRPLLTQGSKVHIIAHSWGSVVAYEGMRKFDQLNLPGTVKNLIVAGSALSIGAVQSNLFGRVGDGRRPSHVNRIINLDAGGDIVGGPIKGAFVVFDEHVGLSPTGCTKIPFTNIAINPFCAHSSYFQLDNLAVNRDLFAHFINS